MKFPGLISGCTINWLQRWPKDALIAVANHFFSSFNIVCEAEVKDQLIVSMGTIHDGVARSCKDYFDRFVSRRIGKDRFSNNRPSAILKKMLN